MSSRHRRSRSAKRKAPAAGRPFLRRRSTKWLAAAVITLTVGIVLGVVGDQLNSDDTDSGHTPTPTIAAPLP